METIRMNMMSLIKSKIKNGGSTAYHESVTDVEEIEIPEDIQKNLHKLGFRKPKSKRKKSDRAKKNQKKEEKAAKAPNKAQQNIIDLREDPVLAKIQRKNKNIGTFHCEPELQPHAICFEIRGSTPSHSDVMKELAKLLKTYSEVVIEKLQFDYRAVVNNSPDVDNRWIVTTNSVASRNRLAGSYMRLHGQEVHLRRYDDVITMEYQQYKRMMDFVKMMNTRLGVK